MKIIIVGAGEVGFHIASRLSHENKDVVVIDPKPEAISRVSENIDVEAVLGSGSSPVVLQEAGIKEAEIMLAVTDSDETNLVACLMADTISPATKKLARIRQKDYDAYHQVFHDSPPHIDTVINPEIEVVKTITRLMKVPGAVDVGEFADGRVKLVGIKIDEKSPMAGLLLSDFESRFGRDRPLIAALIRQGDLIIPRGSNRIKVGDVVYFISESEKLEKTIEVFNKKVRPLKRVMIVGGGRIGDRLARKLEKENVQIKVVESDLKRCNELSEKMGKAIVLHGDGSDQKIMMEESIADCDVVVALTGHEETNILVSLLARNLGAQSTITKISKFGYFPLMSTIGLQKVVSPRLSAINSILQEIRKGKVLSAVSVFGEDAEVIEAVALETSRIAGKPLKKLPFPEGTLLVCIITDDEIVIPSGDSVVAPNDRVIIFARRQAVKKLEKMLTVKLRFFS